MGKTAHFLTTKQKKHITPQNTSQNIAHNIQMAYKTATMGNSVALPTTNMS
jgi:hypothetical protein